MSIGRIESVVTRGQAGLVMQWDDGGLVELDLAPVIAAHPVLAPLADPEAFRRVHLSDDGWSIEWPKCGPGPAPPNCVAGRTSRRARRCQWLGLHQFEIRSNA